MGRYIEIMEEHIESGDTPVLAYMKVLEDAHSLKIASAIVNHKSDLISCYKRAFGFESQADYNNVLMHVRARERCRYLKDRYREFCFIGGIPYTKIKSDLELYYSMTGRMPNENLPVIEFIVKLCDLTTDEVESIS